MQANPPQRTKTKSNGPRPQDDYIVDLHQVVKRYESPSQAFTALRGISLQVQPGEFVAVVGKSGSGQTTST